MKQISEEIREFDEWLDGKYAERKDEDDVLPVGMTDGEFVEWAIRILLGDDWHTDAPVSQNQVNEIAMEDIVFRKCGMEAKDRKQRQRSGTMKEETSAEIKKCIDEAERELREKFDELIFDYGDNDGQYFLHNRASGFNVLLEYARKWQKAKEAEEGGK